MNIGDKAPEILGKDEQGRDIRLSDYRGRKLVLGQEACQRLYGSLTPTAA
jgi:hypothetical protein